nr:hypothetical protein CFP56_40036 [Quercus suber]
MGMISTASQENPTATESTSSAHSYSSSTLATSFTPLSKFKYLNIVMIEGSDGHVLQSIQHLTALEEFSLSNYNEDGMELEWQALRKLQYLRLYDHPKLTSLPVKFPSLKTLYLIGVPSLEYVSLENPTATESTSSAHSYSSSTLATSFTPLSKFKYLNIVMIEGSDGHLSATSRDSELSEFDDIAGVDLRNHFSSVTPYFELPQLDFIACPNVFEDTTYSEMSHLSRKLQEPGLGCSHRKIVARSSSAKRRRFRTN